MFEPAVYKVCVGGNVIELTFVWRSQGVPFAAFKSACPRFGKNYKSNLPHVSDILLFGARTPYCESRIGPNICWRDIRSGSKPCIGLLPRVFDEDAAIAPRKQHGPSEAKSDGGCAQTWKFFDGVRSGDEQERDQRQEARREERRSAGWPSQSARRCLAWSASPAKPGIHAHIQSPRKRKRGCRG